MANTAFDNLQQQEEERIRRLERFKKSDNNTAIQNTSSDDNFLKTSVEETERRLERFKKPQQTAVQNNTVVPEKSNTQKVLSSIPEAGKQFGIRAVKSVPEMIKGLDDTMVFGGDLAQRAYNNISDNNIYKGLANYTLGGKIADTVLKNGQNISDFFRPSAEFWQEQSDKIKIDPKYQGLEGLSHIDTALPTAAGMLGDNASNIAAAILSGGGALAAGKAAGLSGNALKTAAAAGGALPVFALEGQYLDKINDFKNTYGRMPTDDELKKIQNVTMLQKPLATAAEMLPMGTLANKVFKPAQKGVGKVLRDTAEQILTESATEGIQEGFDIGSEKYLGTNQGDNLKRVLDSMVSGGLVGGIMGGTGSVLSQQYGLEEIAPKTAAKQKANKEVSAKVMNNGKELYNSSVNRADTFDNLKTLSREGSLTAKSNTKPLKQITTTNGNTLSSYIVPASENTQTDLKTLAPKTFEKQNSDVIDLVKGKDYTVNEEVIQPQKKLGTSKSTALVPYEQAQLQTIAPKTFAKRQETQSFKEAKPDGWGNKRYEIIDKNDKLLGFVEYSNHDNDSVYLGYVKNESGNDRSGMGTKLVDKVVSENPNKVIIWDTVNNEKAQKFKQSYIKNHPEVKNKICTEGEYNMFVAQSKKYGYNNVVNFLDDLANGKLTSRRQNTNNFGKLDSTGNEYIGSSSRSVQTNTGSQGTNRQRNITTSAIERTKTPVSNGTGSSGNTEQTGFKNGIQEISATDNELEKVAPKTYKKQQKTKNAKEKKRQAYAIVSRAIGKSPKWIQMQKNKSSEKIFDLIDKTDDKLDGAFSLGDVSYYPELAGYDNSNEAVGMGAKVAKQAFNDILNNNFEEKTSIYDDMASDDFKEMAEYDLKKAKIEIKTPYILEKINNKTSFTEDDYAELYKKLLELPEEQQEQFFDDIDKIDDIIEKQNTLNSLKGEQNGTNKDNGRNRRRTDTAGSQDNKGKGILLSERKLPEKAIGDNRAVSKNGTSQYDNGRRNRQTARSISETNDRGRLTESANKAEREKTSKEIENDFKNKLISNGVDKEVAYSASKLMSVFAEKYGHDTKTLQDWYNKLNITNQPLNTSNAQFQSADSAGAANNAQISAAQKEWKEKGTESKYFKKWFKNSKAVDKNGKPLVVYHGTEHNFKIFKNLGKSRQIGANVGFFFTDSKKMAKRYANDVRVMPTYLSLQNPLIVEPDSTIKIFGEEIEITDTFDFFTQLDTKKSEQEIKAELIKQGYDGIILRDTNVDTPFMKDLHDVYVAFNPEQIKSVNNKGMFDENNPNIYYQSENDNIVDLTNEFDKVPTFEEIEQHIRDIIASGEVFDTLSPEWKIDIKGGKRVVDKITNDGNFQNLQNSAKKRHNKYVKSIKSLINNARYNHSDKNTKPKEKSDVLNYHYFDVKIKIGEKIYNVSLECEENKNVPQGRHAKRGSKSHWNNDTIKQTNTDVNPKTVHLYNIMELKQPKTFYQSAYHGTPHRFDEFSTDKIGTGEGAQAHGWGLYFAENKDVSEGYRKNLINPNSLAYDGMPIEETEFSKVSFETFFDLKSMGKKEIIKKLKGKIKYSSLSLCERELEELIKHCKEYKKYPEKFIKKYSEEYRERLELYINVPEEYRKELEERRKKLEESRKELETAKSDLKLVEKMDFKKLDVSPKGQLFEVDIPENDVLLDEDLLFDEQSEKVQKALKKLLEENPWIQNRIDNSMDNVNGRMLYKIIAYEDGDKEASLLLNEYGIKGITYDGRQDGRCYVVFDDKAVEVLKTYYQSAAMKRSQFDNFDDFYNDVNLKPKNTNDKRQFNALTKDDIYLRIPHDTVLHNNKKHNLTSNEWQELLDNIHIISAAEKSRQKPRYGGTPLLLKVQTNNNTYGAVIEIFKKNNPIISTAFIDSEKNIDNWIKNEAIPNGTKTTFLDTRLNTIISEIQPDYKPFNPNENRNGKSDYLGYFSENEHENIMGIMKNSNPSTVIHEMGHLFLNGLNEFANVDNTAKEQLNAVNEWLGSKDGNYTTEQQEKFARSFEAYLYKGKAPNNKLRQVFENFKKWLKKVYNDIKNIPNAEISDKVRKIFDDMFSTEENKTETSLNKTMDGEYFHIPNPIKNIKKSYEEYTAFQENLKQGKTIAELTQKGGELEAFAEDLKEFGDYKIIKMSNSSDKNAGRHREKAKIIEINHKVIGNDISKFAETLMHEIKHAEQIREFNNILEHSDLTKSEQNIVKLYTNGERAINENLINKLLNKGNFTREQLVHIKNKRDCSISNKALQRYLKFHEDTLKKIWDKTSGLDKYAKQKYIESLPSNVKKVYDEYKKLYKNYYNSKFESEARINGAEYAERVKNGNYRRRHTFLGISGQRNAGTGYEDSSAEYGKEVSGNAEETQRGKRTEQEDEIDWYSFEEPTSRSEKLKNVKKADKKAKSYIRKWYADIQKDRYDVNKSINSLINQTKFIAKDLSKSTGLKVTDKMVREIMPFLRERTGIPEKLDRPDLKALYNKMSKADKERLTKLADAAASKFRKYYDFNNEVRGIVPETEIENHISHIWDLDKKSKGLLTNYFSTHSRFTKERTIDTLLKGINGIEINGETVYFKPKTLDYAEILKTQSDSLIKAAHDSVLADKVKNLKFNGISLVRSISKAPEDWVEMNHPALNKSVYYKGENDDIAIISKTPVRVHPDIAKTLNTVFETPAKENMFINAYDKVNSVAKQAQLGFSGFHIIALTESALGNLGIKGTLKILNPIKIWDEVVKGNWSIYKDDTIAKQAIEDGLQFGATLDLDQNTIEKIIDDTSNVMEKIPVIGRLLSSPVKGLSKVQKANSRILWDYFHNNYKLECYTTLCTQEMKRKGRELTKAEREEIAQWVNDSFGGQVWENLGISQSQRKAEQRVFLSPDWLRSTTRQFLGMVYNEKIDTFVSSKARESKFWQKAKEIGQEWGIGSMTNDVELSSMRGRFARNFWIRSLVISAIMYNALNVALRMWDKEKNPEFYTDDLKLSDYTMFGNAPGHKFNLFIGRNKDGTERYMRIGKQYKEMPEMITDPIKKLGGKAAPGIQFVSQAFAGHTAGGFKNKDFFVSDYGNTQKTGWDRVGAIGKTAAKSFVPFSANDILNPDKEFSPVSLFAPVSKGMTKYKAINEFKKVYQNGGNNEDMLKIARIAYRNGISKKDIISYRKQGKTEYLKPYKNELKKAFEAESKSKVFAAVDKMEKAGISKEDIKKIKIDVYKDWKKKKSA